MTCFTFDVSVLVTFKSHLYNFRFMSHSGANILNRATSRHIDSLLFQLLDIATDCSTGAAKQDGKILLSQETVLIKSLVSTPVKKCTDPAE